MTISAINLSLSESDLLNILNFVFNKNGVSESFSVKNISINDNIKFQCSYKRWTTINFDFKVKINCIQDNILHCEVFDISTKLLAIPSLFSNFGLNKYLAKLNQEGIKFNNDKIEIDFEVLLADFVRKTAYDCKLKVSNVYFSKNLIHFELNQIAFSA
ncbi:hypothetical protein K5I29_00745 [Flavobacterium agricola]|uniref:Uncharacterized protein n=1 Tax=Flavobacterium agricola TaxID=2870839 RepID=A0ABY6LYV2_9FLAO|nr:hypothetical protein [Flavobacterium agricola]UYW01504.1 hypothetical protein K5I29_00745 [Flavobacterium agricola]